MAGLIAASFLQPGTPAAPDLGATDLGALLLGAPQATSPATAFRAALSDALLSANDPHAGLWDALLSDDASSPDPWNSPLQQLACAVVSQADPAALASTPAVLPTPARPTTAPEIATADLCALAVKPSIYASTLPGAQPAPSQRGAVATMPQAPWTASAWTQPLLSSAIGPDRTASVTTGSPQAALPGKQPAVAPTPARQVPATGPPTPPLSAPTTTEAAPVINQATSPAPPQFGPSDPEPAPPNSAAPEARTVRAAPTSVPSGRMAASVPQARLQSAPSPSRTQAEPPLMPPLASRTPVQSPSPENSLPAGVQLTAVASSPPRAAMRADQPVEPAPPAEFPSGAAGDQRLPPGDRALLPSATAPATATATATPLAPQPPAPPPAEAVAPSTPAPTSRPESAPMALSSSPVPATIVVQQQTPSSPAIRPDLAPVVAAASPLPAAVAVQEQTSPAPARPARLAARSEPPSGASSLGRRNPSPERNQVPAPAPDPLAATAEVTYATISLSPPTLSLSHVPVARPAATNAPSLSRSPVEQPPARARVPAPSAAVAPAAPPERSRSAQAGSAAPQADPTRSAPAPVRPERSLSAATPQPTRSGAPAVGAWIADQDPPTQEARTARSDGRLPTDDPGPGPLVAPARAAPETDKQVQGISAAPAFRGTARQDDGTLQPPPPLSPQPTGPQRATQPPAALPAADSDALPSAVRQSPGNLPLPTRSDPLPAAVGAPPPQLQATPSATSPAPLEPQVAAEVRASGTPRTSAVSPRPARREAAPAVPPDDSVTPAFQQRPAAGLPDAAASAVPPHPAGSASVSARAEYLASAVASLPLQAGHTVKLRLGGGSTDVSEVVVSLDGGKASLELTCATPEAAVAARALEAPVRELLRADGVALQDFRATCDTGGGGHPQNRDPRQDPLPSPFGTEARPAQPSRATPLAPLPTPIPGKGARLDVLA